MLRLTTNTSVSPLVPASDVVGVGFVSHVCRDPLVAGNHAVARGPVWEAAVARLREQKAEADGPTARRGSRRKRQAVAAIAIRPRPTERRRPCMGHKRCSVMRQPKTLAAATARWAVPRSTSGRVSSLRSSSRPGSPLPSNRGGGSDHGLTQTRETRPREAGWRATVPDSSCLRHQGLAQGRTGDRDQSEAIDRAVVGTDRQPTTVLAHRHPDQRLGAVPPAARAARRAPVRLADHLDGWGCAQVLVRGARTPPAVRPLVRPRGHGHPGRPRSPSSCRGRRRGPRPRGPP